MKIVTAAIILKNGKVLVVRRAPGENLAGKWEFPGGKLQGCESPEECLQREIYEELHIRGKTGRHVCDSLFEYASGQMVLKAYFFDWRSGKITLTVHDRMAWLGVQELETLDLAPADIAVARFLKEYTDNASCFSSLAKAKHIL